MNMDIGNERARDESTRVFQPAGHPCLGGKPRVLSMTPARPFLGYERGTTWLMDEVNRLQVVD
jgi:hypothetical protein